MLPKINSRVKKKNYEKKYVAGPWHLTKVNGQLNFNNCV